MADLPIHTDAQGREWKMGNIEPPGGTGALMQAWPIYGTVEAAPMVPRSQWDENLRDVPNADPFLPYIHFQGKVGQCNADATTAAMEAQHAEQREGEVLILSPADLYVQINNGVDKGSTLQDGMRAAMNTGVGTATTVGRMIWEPGMREAPAAERRLHRVTHALLCPSFDACMSAVISGYKLITGVPWYNVYNPDADGWLPNPWGSPVGGHAIFGYAPTRRSSGMYGIWHRQSWGNWGLGGSFVLSEANYWGNNLGGWWAIRAVADIGGILPAPIA